MNLKDIVVVGAIRTPIGKFGGMLSSFSASDLGAIVIEEAIKRCGLSGQHIDEVIMGNVIQAGEGHNPARQASIKAGIPKEIPATTINKVCASGLKAVSLAAQAIQVGEADIIVAGGMESMSPGPIPIRKGTLGTQNG